MPDRARRSEAHKTLLFALEKYPDRIQAIDLDQLMIESARQNEKRPAFVKIAVPDEWVKSLRGPREGQSRLLLVEVPQEVERRSESSIILPGEL
ncbi:MAG TPA: hypothetical protein VMR44_06880 [Thermoanaerobaculia bacterium]|nr:hypothetical protein [Thermoanaerobaculia bacterium]